MSNSVQVLNKAHFNVDQQTNTTNGDVSYLSYSDNLTYFKIDNRSTVQDNIHITYDAFLNALKEDPKLAIQNLFHARDARNGKGFKDATLCLVVQLKNILKNVPNYATNYKLFLKEFVKYGSFKDLLEINKLSSLQNNSDNLELEVMSEQLNIDYFALETEVKAVLDEVKHNVPVTISLCAKWAPSENSTYHEQFLVLRKLMKTSKKEYRCMISALRKKLNLLEIALSMSTYDNINFSHISSKSLFKHNNSLKRNTNANGVVMPTKDALNKSYNEFLTSGKKVNVDSIEPHSIIVAMENDQKSNSTNGPSLYQNMWNTFVEKYSAMPIFTNAVSIIDCSGSMDCGSGVKYAGKDLSVNDIAMALGLLISSCTKVLSDTVISFTGKPSIIHLDNLSLLEKKQKILKVSGGACNTDMAAVFKLISQIYTEKNISYETQLDTLFIFSDGQFDNIIGNSSLSVFEYAKQMFKTKNQKFPNIVFWNLTGKAQYSLANPNKTDERGFAYLSGYSLNVLNGLDAIDEKSALENMKEKLEKYDVSNIDMNNFKQVNNVIHYNYEPYFTQKNTIDVKTKNFRKMLKSPKYPVYRKKLIKK